MKKSIRKVITLLISAMLMVIPMTTAFAAEEVFTLGDNVTGVLNTDTDVLTISGTGEMYNYTSAIDNPLYNSIYRDTVTTAIIEDGITNIGDHAFESLTSLTSVSIPDSVTVIGGSAFRECSNLTSVIIPVGVNQIETQAFEFCTNLATITNLYDGAQQFPRDASLVFYSAGDAVGGVKIAWASPANENFINAIWGKGYTINYFPRIKTGEGSVEATMPMNGTMDATTISVTHPVSVEYTIDPNLGYEVGAFIAPDIAITNNSVVPVNVTVESLASAAGGSVQFTDVAPDAYADWSVLNTADTKTYIALGVQIADGTGWNAGYKADTRYAAESGDSLFGTLNSSITAHMSMVANYGLAFDQNYTAQHNLVFMFDLA